MCRNVARERAEFCSTTFSYYDAYFAWLKRQLRGGTGEGLGGGKGGAGNRVKSDRGDGRRSNKQTPSEPVEFFTQNDEQEANGGSYKV